MSFTPLAPTFTTVGEYESFAQEDWVYPAGTELSQLHMRAKLMEEASEAAKALRTESPTRIIDELGDFIWTATSSGLNAGITLEQSLRIELGSEQMGAGPIKLDRIDELALDLVPSDPVDEMADWIGHIGYYLGKSAKQWHALSPLIDPDSPPEGFADAWILLKRGRTYDGLNQAVLLTSALAQRFGKATIAEVMNQNALKLLRRKQEGKPITKLPD